MINKSLDDFIREQQVLLENFSKFWKNAHCDDDIHFPLIMTDELWEDQFEKFINCTGACKQCTVDSCKIRLIDRAS